MKTKSARANFTESKVTSYLQESLFYFGHGKKYLGYRITDSLELEDGTWKKLGKDHPQVWKVEKHPQWGWNPVLKNLQGSYRGVCRGVGETHVPFIGDDLDRHSGDILAKDHIKHILQTRKLLIQKFRDYVWLAEVNPKNGSVKFFGFNRNRTPIPIAEANEVSKQIHDDQIEAGIGKREVFPHNSPQVFLPMRPDKTTVIDTGVLEKCVRRKKNQQTGKMENVETYSLLAFQAWLRRGTNCDEFQLYKVLKEACANLPDVPSTNAALVFSADAEKMPSPKAETDITLLAAPVAGGSSLNDIRNNPDAFQKDHQFVMWLSRKLRRLPTITEAFAWDRKNHIYNGRWEDGLSERKHRYKAIIPYVARIFDEDKCGDKSQRPELDEKIREWRGKAHCFTKIIRASIKTASHVDEYGDVVEGSVRTVTVERDHVLILAGIMDYVAEHSHSGHDISRDSIQGWWNELAEEGLLPEWRKDKQGNNHKKDNYYYLACRNVLEKMRWFRIDHQYHRGQAKKCYEVIPDLVGTVWSYLNKEEYKTALHNGYVSFDTSKNSVRGNFDLLLSSRPPP